MVTFRFGNNGIYQFEVAADEQACVFPSPASIENPGEILRKALQSPLDFPPLSQAVVPDDRIVLAVDRYTPAAVECVAVLWEELAHRGCSPENVLILQPAGFPGTPLSDPRLLLPPEIQKLVSWKIHDPTDPDQLAYLSTTLAGERIYLARDLVEADLVVTLGEIAFDSVMGIRGTNSILYPGLSNIDAIAKAHGQGHLELGPNDERGLRQLVDEIGWLLGLQFTVQVIAGEGAGVSQILAGLDSSVWNAGREALLKKRTISVPERTEIILLAIDSDGAGHSWSQLGAALSTARNLVAKEGKVIVLTELSAEPGEGINLLRQCHHARDVLKPLRQQTPPDLIPATQLASIVDWAEVYLLSRLDPTMVDELFMIPLESIESVDHLLRVGDSTLFIGGGQHTFGQMEPKSG